MVSRKYIGDYRLENRAHPRTGKIQTVPVYCGPWFAFEEDSAEIRRLKRIVPGLSLVALAAFMAVMLLNAPCGHAFYVMVPFAVMVFPMFFQLALCWRLLTAGEKVTREHKDKLSQRATTCPLFMTFFSAISAAGHVLHAFRVGMTARDAISMACAVVVLACAIALFSLRNRLRLKQLSQ